MGQVVIGRTLLSTNIKHPPSRGPIGPPPRGATGLSSGPWKPHVGWHRQCPAAGTPRTRSPPRTLCHKRPKRRPATGRPARPAPLNNDLQRQPVREAANSKAQRTTKDRGAGEGAPSAKDLTWAQVTSPPPCRAPSLPPPGVKVEPARPHLGGVRRAHGGAGTVRPGRPAGPRERSAGRQGPRGTRAVPEARAARAHERHDQARAPPLPERAPERAAPGRTRICAQPAEAATACGGGGAAGQRGAGARTSSARRKGSGGAARAASAHVVRAAG